MLHPTDEENRHYIKALFIGQSIDGIPNGLGLFWHTNPFQPLSFYGAGEFIDGQLHGGASLLIETESGIARYFQSMERGRPEEAQEKHISIVYNGYGKKGNFLSPN